MPPPISLFWLENVFATSFPLVLFFLIKRRQTGFTPPYHYFLLLSKRQSLGDSFGASFPAFLSKETILLPLNLFAAYLLSTQFGSGSSAVLFPKTSGNCWCVLAGRLTFCYPSTPFRSCPSQSRFFLARCSANHIRRLAPLLFFFLFLSVL